MFLLWLALFGTVLFGAARLLSRVALRVVTVLVLLVGAGVLAHAGRSAEGADGKPLAEVVLLGAREAGSDLTEPLGLGDVPLDPAAGVGVLFVLVSAYRRAEIVNARRTPGPVEVRTFTTGNPPEAKTGEGGADRGVRPDPAALEARMRQRLADANVLPPPSVPGGSDQKELVEVMQKSPLGEVGGVGKILAFVARAAFPDVGYYVTGTLISERDTGGCGVTVTLNDSLTSSTLAVRTFVARTYEQAVDSAAFFVAQNLLLNCTTLPEWQQWRDCRALEAYHRGRRAVTEEDWEEAAKAFAEAGIASPNNVHPLLEQAAVCELRDYHHEALVSYLTTLKRLPKLIEARYRLAVAYANAESWDALVFTEAEKRARLRRAIDEYLQARWPDDRGTRRPSRPANPLAGMEQPEPPTPDIVNGFYALAQRELEDLEADLGRWRFLRWRLRSSRPRRVRCRDALLLSSPPLIRGPRRMMLATVKTARVSLDLKRHRLWAQTAPAPATDGREQRKASEAGFEQTMERKLRQGAGWQAYYNAACFYSMRMTELPPEPERREQEGDDYRRALADWEHAFAAWENDTDNNRLAERGVKHLETAFLDPGSEFNPRPAWIVDPEHGDHDLDKLRRHRRFRDWQEEMRLQKKEEPPEQREREELGHAWYRLAQFAWGLAKESEWEKVESELRSAADLRGWCGKEQELWERLAQLARRPLDLPRWKRFSESASATRPGLCAIDVTAKGPRRSDWHDPLVTAAEHRASWRALTQTATEVAERWRQRAGAANEASNADLRGTVERWVEGACETWECVARCSLRPLDPALSEELHATVQQLGAGNGGEIGAGRSENGAKDHVEAGKRPG